VGVELEALEEETDDDWVVTGDMAMYRCSLNTLTA